MPRLTLALVSELGSADVREVVAIDASERGIDDVADLGPCIELRKLDLHGNALTSVRNVNCALVLTVLNLAKNAIRSIAGIEELENLAVLNLGHNEVSDITPLARLRSLKAAVLNDNRIRDASALNGLPELNTAVLAGNRVERLDLRRCPLLRKLNASKNGLRVCPEVGGCYHLKELRLNGNKLLGLPDALMSCAQLCTLEVGHNLVMDVGRLSVITHLKFLKTLNVKGNKFDDTPETRSKLLAMAPSVTVLDGAKVEGKHRHFLHPKPGAAAAAGAVSGATASKGAGKGVSKRRGDSEGVGGGARGGSDAGRRGNGKAADVAPSKRRRRDGNDGSSHAAEATHGKHGDTHGDKSAGRISFKTAPSDDAARADESRSKKADGRGDGARVAATVSAVPAAASGEQSKKRKKKTAGDDGTAGGNSTAPTKAAKKSHNQGDSTGAAAPAAAVAPAAAISPAAARPVGLDATAVPAASGVVAVRAVRKKLPKGAEKFDPSAFADSAPLSAPGWD